MKKIVMVFASALLLSSCSIIPVHKMDIQQGNIFTPEMTHKIHRGMSEAQVRDIMGTPILLNTFNDDRVDYVYTFQAGNNPMSEKYMTLIFRNGVLQEIKGDMYSQFIK